MRSGSLIGFTEAELALILLVVFAIIIPARRDEIKTQQPPERQIAALKDSLRIAQDSLRAAALRKAALEDSLKKARFKAETLVVALGELRSPADPSCAALPGGKEPHYPLGEQNPIRILQDGYEFGGERVTVEQIGDKLREFTARAERLRCRYSLVIQYHPDLPAGRVQAFRTRFNRRFFINDRVDR